MTDQQTDLSPATEEVRLAWASAALIVAEVANRYPTNIFIPPIIGKISCPDAYSAAGCRLACQSIGVLFEKAKEGHLARLEKEAWS